MPSWCTASIARVRGVIAASTSAGSMLNVSSSTSTNTGSGAAVADRVRGGDERVADRDDLVAGADARSQERQVQRGGAARHRARVRRADGCRELLLEGRDLGPLRHPARQDGPPRGFDLALAEHGAGDGNRRASAAHELPGTVAQLCTISSSSSSLRGLRLGSIPLEQETQPGRRDRLCGVNPRNSARATCRRTAAARRQDAGGRAVRPRHWRPGDRGHQPGQLVDGHLAAAAEIDGLADGARDRRPRGGCRPRYRSRTGNRASACRRRRRSSDARRDSAAGTSESLRRCRPRGATADHRC